MTGIGNLGRASRHLTDIRDEIDRLFDNTYGPK